MQTENKIPKPKVLFSPPIYLCKWATLPFVLDGNVNKEFWQKADYTEDFIDIEGSSMDKPRFNTRAKMLWDNENLYIGAIIEGNEIWANVVERDGIIFQDNDFEVFIDPDSDTHQYYEFEINALNTVWDLFLTKPYRDGGLPINCWDIHGLKSAVKIDGELNHPFADNKQWMVEIVMPFQALSECARIKRHPNIGEYYRMNFSRVQWKVDIVNHLYQKKTDPVSGKILSEDNWVWAPTGVINIHYPELWGFVFFTENGESYQIPTEERIKWELRLLYYKQHHFYEVNGCYTTNFNELKGDYNFTIHPLIEITKHTFEITCQNMEHNGEYYILSDGKTGMWNVK